MNWPKNLDTDLEMQNNYLKSIFYEISVWYEWSDWSECTQTCSSDEEDQKGIIKVLSSSKINLCKIFLR